MTHAPPNAIIGSDKVNPEFSGALHAKKVALLCFSFSRTSGQSQNGWEEPRRNIWNVKTKNLMHVTLHAHWTQKTMCSIWLQYNLISPQNTATAITQTEEHSTSSTGITECTYTHAQFCIYHAYECLTYSFLLTGNLIFQPF